MFIAAKEKLSLIELLLKKELQELLTKSIDIKFILMKFTQPFWNSQGKTLAGDNYSQPMLVRLPSGNSLGETLASEKYPKPKLVQQLSRHSLGETLAYTKYPLPDLL